MPARLSSGSCSSSRPTERRRRRCCCWRCRDGVATGWRCLLRGRSLSGSTRRAEAAETREARGILALLRAPIRCGVAEYPASVSQATALTSTANEKRHRRRHVDLSFRRRQFLNVCSLESCTMGQPVKGFSSVSPATLNRLVPGIGPVEAAGMLIQLE
jgi:hypothetical protein